MRLDGAATDNCASSFFAELRLSGAAACYSASGTGPYTAAVGKRAFGYW